MYEKKGVELLESVDLVRVPGWEQYAWLWHGFSRRAGGASTVYGAGSGKAGDLNLGWTKEDDPATVAENRRRFVGAVGGEDGFRLVTVRQVHGVAVRAVRAGDGALEGRLETAEGKAVLEGDGLMTDLPGALLGIQTADCVPVLVADLRRRAVAAIHAGWRGTVARIVEQGIAAMAAEYGSRPEDLVAAIGPSIGVCCYEVGAEVRGEFEAAFDYADELFQEGSRLDLWEANRRQLLEAGVASENIAVLGECSGCSVGGAGRRRYFSHRVERGLTGRMLSVVGVEQTRAS